MLRVSCCYCVECVLSFLYKEATVHQAMRSSVIFWILILKDFEMRFASYTISNVCCLKLELCLVGKNVMRIC